MRRRELPYILGSIVALAAFGASSASASAASISGSVFDAANARAIPGALACAKTSENGASACAATDAAGHYEIGNLAALSDYRVSFSAGPDYVTQFYSEEPDFADADQIDVTGGDQADIDADLAEVAPGTISGRVSAKKTGSPVAEIQVCALAAGAGEVVGCGASAADGSYLLSLPFGSYKVAFNQPAPEHFNPLYLSQFWNGATSLAAASAITLAGPEARSGIDAVLQIPGETAEAPVTAPAPPATGAQPTAPPTPRPLVCKKGFRKEKVKGAPRCVKKKHHHHRRKRRHS